jgi:hypothetical protein
MSDANGAYSIRLPAGERAGLAISKAGYSTLDLKSTDHTEVRLHAGDSKTRDFEMSKPGTMRGRRAVPSPETVLPPGVPVSFPAVVASPVRIVLRAGTEGARTPFTTDTDIAKVYRRYWYRKRCGAGAQKRTSGRRFGSSGDGGTVQIEDYLLTGHRLSTGFAGSAAISRAAQ